MVNKINLFLITLFAFSACHLYSSKIIIVGDEGGIQYSFQKWLSEKLHVKAEFFTVDDVNEDIEDLDTNTLLLFTDFIVKAKTVTTELPEFLKQFKNKAFIALRYVADEADQRDYQIDLDNAIKSTFNKNIYQISLNNEQVFANIGSQKLVDDLKNQLTETSENPDND